VIVAQSMVSCASTRTCVAHVGSAAVSASMVGVRSTRWTTAMTVDSTAREETAHLFSLR
jgi:hypothetical protein